MGPSLEISPQVTMVECTPVEHGTVEYKAKEYEIIEYKEFTRYNPAVQGQKQDQIWIIWFFHFELIMCGTNGNTTDGFDIKHMPKVGVNALSRGVM